ncbi:NUDIX domain-containing protein [Prauserella endophytica]|uniref:NUDIX hydrolase n=1 Tax=Prauserella endophytica TaxID=1592324 RepID=A0ABY2RV11_9PSEU|nr:NUDIX hydrolase [Prauserella endophytica]TKG61555.1 NUDIX hydrolase [Prauserella endophytica]
MAAAQTTRKSRPDTAEFDRLTEQEQRLSEEVHSTANAAARAELYARGSELLDRLADLRPTLGGRTRDIAPYVAERRNTARLFRTVAEIETSRAQLAAHGWYLPDPVPAIRGDVQGLADYLLALHTSVATRAAAGDARTEHARLTADVVALGYRHGRPHVLLIERGWPPHEGQLALPGGHVDPGEPTWAAARRELQEETGLTVGELRQVGVYSEPGRDPRGRYVTTAYLTQFDTLPEPTAGDDARAARWVPVNEVLSGERMAFDHAVIVRGAVRLTDQRS